MPGFDLASIVDNHSVIDEGFNFVHDARNRWPVDGIAFVHRSSRTRTIYRGRREPDVQPRRDRVVFAAGQEVEGGIVSFSTYVGRSTSQSHRIG
jgi:hypothetical protein